MVFVWLVDEKLNIASLKIISLHADGLVIPGIMDSLTGLEFT